MHLPNDKRKSSSIVLLLLTSVIWGTTFVAQNVGVQFIGPFTFNGVRAFITSFTLLSGLIIYLMIKKQPLCKVFNKKALVISASIGLIFFIATTTQQFGIKYSSVGKAGFLTSLYIIFVPLLNLLFKKKVAPIYWLWVMLAIVGTFLLCLDNGEIKFHIADGLLIISALGFACQIVMIERFANQINAVLLTGIQFLTVFILSIIPVLSFERTSVTIEAFKPAWFSLFYAGLISGCLAYTMQVYAQKKISAVVASLIMSLEAVFALIAGVIILKQFLNGYELIGSICLFTAVIFSVRGQKK